MLPFISPRRWVNHRLFKIAKELERKKIKFCFIDLFKRETKGEFYEYFASEIIKNLLFQVGGERLEQATKRFSSNLYPKIFGTDPTQDFFFNFLGLGGGSKRPARNPEPSLKSFRNKKEFIWSYARRISKHCPFR